MKYFVIGSKGLGFGSNRDAVRSPVTRRRLMESNLRKAVLLFTPLAILGCADNKQAGVSTGRSLGANSSVGNGMVWSYAELDKSGAPKAIGIVFQASALDGLPTAHSDGHHCFDRNKDGEIDLQAECLAAHEWVIPLSSEGLGVRKTRLNGWACTGTRAGISLRGGMICPPSTFT